MRFAGNGRTATEQIARLGWGVVKFRTYGAVVPASAASIPLPRAVTLTLAHKYFAIHFCSRTALNADGDSGREGQDEVAWGYDEVEEFVETVPLGQRASCRVTFKDKSPMDFFRPDKRDLKHSPVDRPARLRGRGIDGAPVDAAPRSTP